MLESYRKEFLDLVKLIESKHVAGLSVSKNKKNIMFQNIEERYEKIRHDIAKKLEELNIISDAIKYTRLFKGAKIHDHFIECELEKATTKVCKIYSSSMEKLIPYHLKIGKSLFKKGQIEDAFDAWETVLKINPDNKFIHLQLHRILSMPNKFLPTNGTHESIVQRAVSLVQKYHFSEDKSFMASLHKISPLGPLRCIDFDKFGSIYLNDVSKACIVKISNDRKMKWELGSEKWTLIHRHCMPWGFGSFSIVNNQLMITDFRSRHLVFVDFNGRYIKKIKLPLECPSFAQFVSVRNKFHIPDETLGVVTIFDSKFNKISDYRHKDERFRPVQILWLQEKEMILAAFGNQGFASRIEAFNLEGRHLFTFASFDENPCHVVKFDIDEHNNVFAVDHYGKIYKFDWDGNLIWTFSEKQRFDRFKYVKYYDSYLYISDAFTIRRFRVN